MLGPQSIFTSYFQAHIGNMPLKRPLERQSHQQGFLSTMTPRIYSKVNVCEVAEKAIIRAMKNFAFIDAQNVHLGIKSLGWQLDWGRFRVYLREKYKVTKAYLFIYYE